MVELWVQIIVPLVVALITSTALWGVVSKELTAKYSKADEAQIMHIALIEEDV